MNFILYYVLIRFFVKLDFGKDEIHLTKGVIFRREIILPLCSVISCGIIRTPLLRLFGAKKITLGTLSGNVSLYLKRDEPFPYFSAVKPRLKLKPKLPSVLLAALADTRALNGAVFFSAVSGRIASVSSDYYNRIISAIQDTAGGLNETLQKMKIYVPKIATLLAVFAAVFWLLAFIRNVLKYLRFSLYSDKGCTVVCHGVITLYEHRVVPHSTGQLVIRDTVLTIFTDCPPLWFGKTMLLPPIKRKKLKRAAELISGAALPDKLTSKPKKRALLGHIAVPLGWGLCALGLLLLSLFTHYAPLLRTVFWAGLIVCGWYGVAFFLYMRRTGYGRNEHCTAVSARRGTALITLLSLYTEEHRRMDVNPVGRHSDMCNIMLFYKDRVRLCLRGMSISEPL